MSMTATVMMAVTAGCGDTGDDVKDAKQMGRSSPSATAPKRDANTINVLVITLDTVRADALGIYGATPSPSPNLDAFARAGVLFEQAATSAPSTLPAHSTVFTGLFPPKHGVRSNVGYALPDEVTTLAEVLSNAGYATGAEIAATVLDAPGGLSQGFDHYRDLSTPGVGTHRTRRVDRDSGTEHVIEIRERFAEEITRAGEAFFTRHQNRPFFLWLHYFDPHLAHFPREPYRSRHPADPYAAEISYMDDQIGRLLARLAALQLDENTLVVIVADHGEGRGEHAEPTHAFFVYETTMRVPLMLRLPGTLPSGYRVSSLVRTADIMPTVLDLVGVSSGGQLQGRSLRPLMSGAAADLELVSYGEASEITSAMGAAPLRTVRRGRWKYIHHVVAELYDLEADPGELRNVAGKYPEKVSELRAELTVLMEGGMSPTPRASIELNEEQAEDLRALGYLVAVDPTRVDGALASLEVSGPTIEEIAGPLERYNRALTHQDSQFFERAAPLLAALTLEYPDNFAFHLSYAEVLSELDRVDLAGVHFEQALLLEPCANRARVLFAQVAERADRPEAKWLALCEVPATCTPSVEVLNNCAVLLAEGPIESRRDPERAVRMAELAIARAGNDDPALLDTLATAQTKAGLRDEALVTARRALSLARQQGAPQEVLDLLRSRMQALESPSASNPER